MKLIDKYKELRSKEDITNTERIILDAFEYNIFKNKPSKKDKAEFEELYEVKYPKQVEDISKSLYKDLRDTIKYRKEERKLQERNAKQRAERGFCDSDVWDVGYWFINTCRNILNQLADTHMGFPTSLEIEWLKNHPEIDIPFNEWVCWPSDEDSEEYKLRVKATEECDKQWTEIIEHLVFLLNEMDEDTCSMKNPYEEDWWNYHKAFSKKYAGRLDELKTEEEKEDEKRTHTILHIGPERDPDFGKEYKKISNKYLNYERKIYQYRDKCKNEFFKLFSKYFWDLWD